MVFDRVYCADAPCLPSRMALMTGRFGIHTGVVGHGGTAADMRLEGADRGFASDFGQRDSLWLQFRQAGMWTASVSPYAERHSAWWFHAGLNETLNPGRRGMESAEEVTPLALDWINRRAKRDGWLLHVNYWDPHTPYRAPAEFGNPFAADPLRPIAAPTTSSAPGSTSITVPGGRGRRISWGRCGSPGGPFYRRPAGPCSSPGSGPGCPARR